MPALQWFGRRWCIASDDLPLPASLGLLVHVTWSAVLLSGLASIAATRVCPSAALFTTFVAEMLACFAAGAILFGALVWFSSRGAIHETRKRRMVPIILYLLLINYTLLFITSIYGTTMVLTHVPTCLYNHLSQEAVRITRWVVFTSWAVVAALLFGVVLSFNVYHDFRDERTWQASCRCVAMCFCCQPEAMTSPEDGSPPPLVRVASFFNSMFAHIDMTVSDIVACLLLLNLDQAHNRQTSASSQGSGAALLGMETSTTSSSTFEDPQVPVRLEDLEEALHYHKYALAAYGWMMYVWTHRGKADKCCRLCFNGCFGCCQPSARLRPRVPRVFRAQDMKLTRSRSSVLTHRVASFTPRLPSYVHQLHRSTILETSGIQPRQLMYVNYVNLVAGRLPYFIALDEVKRCVVVSIRGSLSVEDCLTDVLCEPEVMDEAWLSGAYTSGTAPVQVLVEGAEDTGNTVMLAHHGMMKSARAILADLDRHNILRALLDNDEEAAEKLGDAYKRDCSRWRLVLVGHSLGSGVAALLSFPLRVRYPNIKCWLFAPPGGVLSPAAAAHVDPIAVALIHAEDIVPRLSMAAVERLRDQMVEVSVRCRYSKLMLLIHAVLGVSLNRERLFAPLADLPPPVQQVFQQFQESVSSSRHLLGTYQPARTFVTPGKLLYLERMSDKLLDGTLVSQYIPRWVSRAELSNQGLRICPTSFTDHFPDTQIHNLAAVVDHMQGRSARSRASLLQTVVTFFSASTRSASSGSHPSATSSGSRHRTHSSGNVQSSNGSNHSPGAGLPTGRNQGGGAARVGVGSRRSRGHRSGSGGSRLSVGDPDGSATMLQPIPSNTGPGRGNGGRASTTGGTYQRGLNEESDGDSASQPNHSKPSSGSTSSATPHGASSSQVVEGGKQAPGTSMDGNNAVSDHAGSSGLPGMPQLIPSKPRSRSSHQEMVSNFGNAEVVTAPVATTDVFIGIMDDDMSSGVKTMSQSDLSSASACEISERDERLARSEPGLSLTGSTKASKRLWGRRKTGSGANLVGSAQPVEIPLDIVSRDGTVQLEVSTANQVDDLPLIDLSSPVKGHDARSNRSNTEGVDTHDGRIDMRGNDAKYTQHDPVELRHSSTH